MKTCTKCPEKGPQPLDNFHKRGEKGAAVCKECRKAVHRDHYERNRDKYVKQSRSRRDDFLRRVAEIKGSTPCTDCKRQFPAVCMDFDHLDGADKEGEIARLIANGKSWEKITEEMAKCEVVCACCHRLRTADRLKCSRSSIGRADPS